MAAMARYPTGARDESKSVPVGSKPEEIFAMPASVSLRSVSRRTGAWSEEKSFGVVQWWVPPSQYFGSAVLGVPPPTQSTTSPTGSTVQPFGMWPASESWKAAGKIDATLFRVKSSSLGGFGVFPDDPATLPDNPAAFP